MPRTIKDALVKDLQNYKPYQEWLLGSGMVVYAHFDDYEERMDRAFGEFWGARKDVIFLLNELKKNQGVISFMLSGEYGISLGEAQAFEEGALRSFKRMMDYYVQSMRQVEPWVKFGAFHEAAVPATVVTKMVKSLWDSKDITHRIFAESLVIHYCILHDIPRPDFTLKGKQNEYTPTDWFSTVLFRIINFFQPPKTIGWSIAYPPPFKCDHVGRGRKFVPKDGYFCMACGDPVKQEAQTYLIG